MKDLKFQLLVLIAACSGSLNTALAQSGCTDPSASNYSASAVTNDGSCVYPVTHYTPVLRHALSTDIPESSGLVYCDGQLWTHNDSGNPASFFRIDTTTGHTVQTIKVDNYPNTDWEDMAADSGYIYLGNFGNNNGDRKDLNILKIKKADITSFSTVHVNAQAINFSYADQTSFTSSSTNNFDCEALVSIKDSLYLFTKDRGDLKTRVYKLPKTPGTYSVAPYTSFNVNGLITGADYDTSTKEVVLVGYMNSHLNSFLWFLNDFTGDQFFSGNKRRIEIGGTADWPTEGVTFMSDNRLFISCEAAGSLNASLYIATKDWLNPKLAVPGPYTNNTIQYFPNPVTGTLTVTANGDGGPFMLCNVLGQVVKEGQLCSGNNIIDLNDIKPGFYQLKVNDATGGTFIASIVKQ